MSHFSKLREAEQIDKQVSRVRLTVGLFAPSFVYIDALARILAPSTGRY